MRALSQEGYDAVGRARQTAGSCACALAGCLWDMIPGTAQGGGLPGIKLCPAFSRRPAVHRALRIHAPQPVAASNTPAGSLWQGSSLRRPRQQAQAQRLPACPHHGARSFSASLHPCDLLAAPRCQLQRTPSTPPRRAQQVSCCCWQAAVEASRAAAQQVHWLGPNPVRPGAAAPAGRSAPAGARSPAPDALPSTLRSASF